MPVAPTASGAADPADREAPARPSALPSSDGCAVFLCRCGDIISETVDLDRVQAEVACLPGVASVRQVDFLCSEEGLEQMRGALRAELPGRVVVAACSPKEHEDTFRRVLAATGPNPYRLQMANVREQVAWVTPDREEAKEKTARMVHAAVSRVALHASLHPSSLAGSPDVMVGGAGPAGLMAALTLAEAGRRVTLVERGPALGGRPVLYDEVFPSLECGPCMLEPLMDRALHGDLAERIELLTLSQVEGVVGSFGNFTASIRQSPRFIDGARCIGCGLCAEACPAFRDHAASAEPRKAISFAYPGALPNLPDLAPEACLRFQGQPCSACLDQCPVAGAIDFDDQEAVHARAVGGVILATGFGLYEAEDLPGLARGRHPGVLTHFEAERALASNGPSGGALPLPEGTTAPSVVMVHCVGSLDPRRRSYCSSTCCQEALKLNRIITRRYADATITHLYRELALPGKGAGALLAEVNAEGNTTFARYRDLEAMEVTEGPHGGARVRYVAEGGGAPEVSADLVVLLTAMTPGRVGPELGAKLGVGLDDQGFFQASHERMDPVWSNVRGVYLAGSCQAPGDIREATASGMAAAGQALAALVEGRELVVSPVGARVDEAFCSGCGVCVGQCPYKAVSLNRERKKAEVNPPLCHACGTCVAACPSGAMEAIHFTDAQIQAEVAVLAR
ncbi:MAG: CoB--CoM heterodisulfide reductase iron-sulfur subunit A family protein [Gemmatimonadetes bacterium]|nr:CoB--CoM heterodisulfide reductase iron-sulfur subunit A family protein [Gemmatimonadota bacterium]